MALSRTAYEADFLAWSGKGSLGDYLGLRVSEFSSNQSCILVWLFPRVEICLLGMGSRVVACRPLASVG